MTDLQVKYQTFKEAQRHNLADEARRAREVDIKEKEYRLAKQKNRMEVGTGWVKGVSSASRDITGMFKDLAGGLHDVVGVAGTISGMLG